MDSTKQSNHEPRDSYRGRNGEGVPYTVRVGVKALATDRNRILLIRERRHDGSTFWTLPGGGVRPGENPVACLRRELDEELGCQPEVGPVIGSCRYNHTTLPGTLTLYHIYACNLKGRPRPNQAEGIIEWSWKLPQELPPATLTPFQRLLQPPAIHRFVNE